MVLHEKNLSLSSLGNGLLNLLDGPDSFKKELFRKLTENPFWRSLSNVYH